MNKEAHHGQYASKRKNRSRYTLVQPTRNPKNILIKGSPYVISVNDAGDVEVRQNCSVYIEGTDIKGVYNAGQEEVNEKELDLVYDAEARGGIVLTPGFINAHTHTPMYLMRSAMLLDYGQHLDETVEKMPLWQKYIEGASAVVSSLGDLTEQQKAGITTSLNHNAVYKEPDTAAERCGQRLINCVSAVSNSRPDITLDTAAEYITAQKPARSVAGIAIHYLYKIEEEILKQVRVLQERHACLVTIHFAESEGVAERAVQKFGMRETALLEKYGLLNPLTLLSHVLHVTEDEIQLLIEREVGIVHLPTSNAIHKSGVFDFPKFAEYEGVDRIALGTDSVVSKSRLDLLTEAFQTRMTHLPEYTVYYEDLFKMLTSNGAAVINQPSLGRIAPGYKADIAFWKLKDRGFIPFDEENPLTLVGNIISHGGRNIRDLMIDGEFIISNRVHNLVDESELMLDIQKYHMEVKRKVDKDKA